MEAERNIAAELIDSTIRVIAHDGLDRASIRAISADCRIPNPYIYHHFKDKEQLIAAAFGREDSALTAEFLNTFSAVYREIEDPELRCRVIWRRLWDYMMSHREGIQFYVRYYYSAYYRRYSKTEHQERIRPLVEAVRECFIENTNVQALIQHLLDSMMSMAIKVYRGELCDHDKARSNYFSLTMEPLTPYLRTR